MKAALALPGLLLMAAAAFALDPPKPEQAAPEADATEAPAEPAPGGEVLPPEAPAAALPEEEEELPPLPPGTRQVGPTPQRFEPTEKVRADFPVSFPIDI